MSNGHDDHDDHDHHDDHGHHGHGHSAHDHAPASFGRGVRDRHRPQRGFRFLEASRATSAIPSRCSPTPRTISAMCWGSRRLDRQRSRAPRALGAVHLRPARLVDPRRAVQCGLFAADDRRDFLGGDPAARAVPNPCRAKTVMIVAAIGIVINGVTAWLFASGRKGDLNLRAAFAHMASDAMVSAGVVVAGLVILLTGWLWLDPARQSCHQCGDRLGHMGLASRFRRHVDGGGAAPISTLTRCAGLSRRVPASASLHDLHIWPMSTTEIALTCHLVMPAGHPGDAFIHDLCEELSHRFRIRHATLQIEVDRTSPARSRRTVSYRPNAKCGAPIMAERDHPTHLWPAPRWRSPRQDCSAPSLRCRNSSESTSPFMLAGLMYLGTGLGLAAYRLFRDRFAPESGEAQLRRADMPWLAIAIAMGGVLGPVLLVFGVSRTTASSAALMLNMEGLATMAIAWIVFRRKRRPVADDRRVRNPGGGGAAFLDGRGVRSTQARSWCWAPASPGASITISPARFLRPIRSSSPC